MSVKFPRLLLKPCGPKRLIGMVHVGALPGTPRQRQPLDEVIARAAEEAEHLERAGFDALIIENMHDLPYLSQAVGPEIVASMTAVALAVRGAVKLPLGVQVLAAANREAIAVAQASGAGFVRAENFVYSHVADEGHMPTASAGPLLRYRKQIGAEHIQILADVKKKHAAHAITADVSIAEAAAAAELCGASGVIVTGSATGKAADAEELRAVRAECTAPILIGSGITSENLPDYWPLADGFIVGSTLKRGGVWSYRLDPHRVRGLISAARRCVSRSRA